MVFFPPLYMGYCISKLGRYCNITKETCMRIETYGTCAHSLDACFLVVGLQQKQNSFFCASEIRNAIYRHLLVHQVCGAAASPSLPHSFSLLPPPLSLGLSLSLLLDRSLTLFHFPTYLPCC